MDKEKTHFDLMEEVGQINIFEIIKDDHHNLKIGDKVKCNITKENDWEGYNYLQYYAPFVLKELGEVVSIIGEVVNVRYKTTVMMFNVKELDF